MTNSDTFQNLLSRKQGLYIILSSSWSSLLEQMHDHDIRVLFHLIQIDWLANYCPKARTMVFGKHISKSLFYQGRVSSKELAWYDPINDR